MVWFCLSVWPHLTFQRSWEGGLCVRRSISSRSNKPSSHIPPAGDLAQVPEPPQVQFLNLENGHSITYLQDWF